MEEPKPKPKPKRPSWRKRRWWAAGALALALPVLYPTAVLRRPVGVVVDATGAIEARGSLRYRAYVR